MTGMRLIVHQFRYDTKIFWRNPAAVFFAIALPLIFLFIFSTVFGNQVDPTRHIKISTYYVPGIIALGVISVTFVTLAHALTALRERGILKRLRGTPLPTGVFVSGRVGSSLVIALILSAVILTIGHLVYGVAFPGAPLVGVLATIVIGACSFCTLGFAITVVIPNEAAASPITNAVILPLYFISGIFFPVDTAPQWLTNVADVFPVRPFALALLDGFTPGTAGIGLALGHLAVVAAWGIAGLVVAVLFFRWSPQGD